MRNLKRCVKDSQRVRNISGKTDAFYIYVLEDIKTQTEDGWEPTRAPWDLVVVAPRAVGLTDGRRQLLAGQPVAVIAKVGNPGPDRVVGGEDAAVERGLGCAAGDG